MNTKKVWAPLCAFALGASLVSAPLFINTTSAYAVDNPIACDSSIVRLELTDDSGHPGRTFSAYKLANIDGVAGTLPNSVKYSISSVKTNGVDEAILGAFASAGVTNSEATGAQSVATMTSDNWKTDAGRSSDIRKVANKLAQMKGSLGTPITFNAGTIDDNTLAPGVYLITDNTDIGVDSSYSKSAPMIVSTELTSANGGQCVYTAAAEVKATNTTITKDIKAGTDRSNFTNKNVSFTLTVPVPSRAAYAPETFKFYITDTLPAGLSYVANSARVSTSVASDQAIEPAVTTSGKTLVWNFSDVALTSADDRSLNKDSGTVAAHAAGDAGTNITITYDAVIGEDFVVGDEGNLNTATVTYTNSPDSEYEGSDTEKTYQGEFNIYKTDSKGAKLAGATFQVKSQNDEREYNVTVLDAVDGNNADGEADGYLNFTNLKATEAGVTYTVHEVSAPEGYEVVDDFTVTVKLVADESQPGSYKVTYEVDGAGASSVKFDAGTNNRGGKATLSVTDLTTIENLAKTGGQLATILAVAAALLVGGIVFGHIRRKTTTRV